MRRDEGGQVGEGEPAEPGVLLVLLDGGGPLPGAGGEEEVDPLLDGGAADVVGAVHSRQRGQVLRGQDDADLLAGLPAGGLEHGLTALDVPGRPCGPVAVHVPRVPAQLEEDLGARGRGAGGAGRGGTGRDCASGGRRDRASGGRRNVGPGSGGARERDGSCSRCRVAGPARCLAQQEDVGGGDQGEGVHAHGVDSSPRPCTSASAATLCSPGCLGQPGCWRPRTRHLAPPGARQPRPVRGSPAPAGSRPGPEAASPARYGGASR